MIADLKPYRAYKRTDIEWLAGLPSHWHELSLKRVARSENSGCYGNEPENRAKVIPVATTAQIDRDGNFAVSRMPQRGFTQEEAARYCCKTGDILVVKSSGSAANVISGKAGIVRADTPPFVFSNFLMRFVARTAHVDPEFLFLILTCNLTRERVRRMVSTTTYPNLRVSEYCSALLPIPPLADQAAIVRFLHWSNGQLERAIWAKRKVIALLNEQKQAIIHRAVTRGLDPIVPLKPSGISWLGEIPAHWELRRIKYLLREVDERSTTGNEPLLSMRMHHGLVLFAEHFSRPPQAATLVGFKIVRPGQFVVNRMQAGNGVIFASTLTGLVSPDYAVFDPIGEANVDFLGELFRSRKVRAKFRAESKGLGTGSSGFLRLYNDRLGAIHVALPPCAEQREILSWLAGELSGVNTAVSRLEREIELLREYRTRLVADVVTGRLDVREAAAQLPEGAPLPTVEDDADVSIDPEALDEAVAE
jgi:type I restriction enzyme S subunit